MMLGFFNQIRVEFGVPIPLDCLDGVLIVNKKPDRLGFRPQRGNIEVLEGNKEGMEFGSVVCALSQGDREVFRSCMWQRGICCVETGARWSWVAKSGAISVHMESIRWESAELAEESFSELGLVLGFMGFGFALELEVCEGGNNALCGSLWERRVERFVVVSPSGTPDGER